MGDNLEKKAGKWDRVKDDLKFGAAALVVGVGLCYGGYKIFSHYDAQREALKAQIPSEYLEVKKIRNDNPLDYHHDDLEFANKLDDPNFRESYVTAIRKYHSYMEDPEVVKILDEIDNKFDRMGRGTLAIIFGVATGIGGLVGTFAFGGYDVLNNLRREKEKNGEK